MQSTRAHGQSLRVGRPTEMHFNNDINDIGGSDGDPNTSLYSLTIAADMGHEIAYYI